MLMEGLKMDDLMEAEGLRETDVWGIGEIEEIEPILPMELSAEVPGMDRAMVCGDPFRLGEILDYQQGFDNPYGATGTCGLTSVSNICKMAGMDVTEPEVVEYAMENDQCIKDDPKYHGRGTTIGNDLAVLSHYGIEAHCEFSDTADGERLAEAIEGGHGVILGVNSGILQDREWKVENAEGEVVSNHAVCLTGTVRDPDTGELAGFYLCDSSSQRPDGGKIFITLDQLDECYTNVKESFAIITDDPIRG